MTVKLNYTGAEIDEAVGKVLGGISVDRGDPSAYDFQKTGLTLDGAWHDLDLSAIVPAGAKFVILRAQIKNTTVGENFLLRKNGNSNALNVSMLVVQNASAYAVADLVVPCDSNQVIEYLGTNGGTWIDLYLIVKGWIF